MVSPLIRKALPHVARTLSAVVQVLKEAVAAEPVDLESLASLLYGIYGADVIEKVEQVLEKSDTVEKAWRSEDHPRGANGRFIPKGSAEARATAADQVRQAIRGDRSSSPQKLMSHLSLLTVKQIRELAKEHGKKVPSAIKSNLMESLRALVGGAATPIVPYEASRAIVPYEEKPKQSASEGRANNDGSSPGDQPPVLPDPAKSGYSDRLKRYTEVRVSATDKESQNQLRAMGFKYNRNNQSWYAEGYHEGLPGETIYHIVGKPRGGLGVGKPAQDEYRDTWDEADKYAREHLSPLKGRGPFRYAPTQASTGKYAGTPLVDSKYTVRQVATQSNPPPTPTSTATTSSPKTGPAIREVKTLNGMRHVHSFYPGEKFWGVWRNVDVGGKKAMKDLGLSVGKNPRTNSFEVSIWGETPKEVEANILALNEKFGILSDAAKQIRGEG